MNETNAFPGAKAPLPEPRAAGLSDPFPAAPADHSSLVLGDAFPFSFSAREVLEVMQTAFVLKAQGLKTFACIPCFC